MFSACSHLELDKQRATNHPPQVLIEHQYQCDNGEILTATYTNTDSATIQYRNKSYTMQIAISASGSRYRGGGYEWWTKGSGTGATGTLYWQMKDGSTGSMIASCKAL